MAAIIKAIVFKTPQFKETKFFFETILKLPIKESSVRHFVIFSGNIRIVFVETPHDFKIELYLKNALHHKPGAAITNYKKYKDPNGLHIVII